MSRRAEHQVAEFACRASAFLEAGRIRRFARRDDAGNLIAEGEALSRRLESDCEGVERQIAVLARRGEDPRVLDHVNTLTQELRAGKCQLQRLYAALDELRSSSPMSFPAEGSAVSR